MARVLGIGLFMMATDPKVLGEWYGRVLGLNLQAWNGVAFDPKIMAARPNASQILSFFNKGSDYIKPSTREFMLNMCVDDLDGVLARAHEHGVDPMWRDDEDPNGKFAHILDPEGTKIELWEPKKVES